MNSLVPNTEQLAPRVSLPDGRSDLIPAYGYTLELVNDDKADLVPELSGGNVFLYLIDQIGNVNLLPLRQLSRVALVNRLDQLEEMVSLYGFNCHGWNVSSEEGPLWSGYWNSSG